MSNDITINLAELIKAVTLPKMKRTPRGGFIPSVTSFDAMIIGKLIVHAPAHSTILSCTGYFDRTFTVEARKLYELLKKLPKIDVIQIFLKDKNIDIVAGKLKVTFPIQPTH